jgi:hypothetical protein
MCLASSGVGEGDEVLDGYKDISLTFVGETVSKKYRYSSFQHIYTLAQEFNMEYNILKLAKQKGKDHLLQL